jgi:hypothetical protein
MSFRRGSVALWLLCALALAMLRPAEAADCRMKTALTLKDSQDGFAGSTGTVWTIKPDCSYTVARFIGTGATQQLREGALAPEQQSQLAALIAANLGAGPVRVGERAPVNAHQLTIEYDGRISVLDLGSGMAELSDVAKRDDAARRIIEVSEAVKRATGG